MSKPQKLDYETPVIRTGHSRSAIASICMGLAILLFTAFVLLWGDPFESPGNEKPCRIAVVAGVVGIILAAWGAADKRCKQRLVVDGILLNTFSMFFASVALPYI